VKHRQEHGIGIGGTMVVVSFLMACAASPVTETPSGIPLGASRKTFSGTVLTGAQLGEVKEHCAAGLYLVAEEGSFLVSQTPMLLLRVSKGDEHVMFSDQRYMGQEVRLRGLYPAQEVFCAALICACEDYILVESIETVTQ